MENNNEKNNQSADELRAAAILRKKTDQWTAEDRAFIAQGIAEWKLENHQ